MNKSIMISLSITIACFFILASIIGFDTCQKFQRSSKLESTQSLQSSEDSKKQ